jgi:hypothetical protein
MSLSGITKLELAMLDIVIYIELSRLAKQLRQARISLRNYGNLGDLLPFVTEKISL